MDKPAYALLLFLYLTLPVCAQSVEISLSGGDYLSVTYIDTLKQTRSPITAGKQSGTMPHAVLKTTDRGYEITVIDNFHEGLGGLSFDRNGKIITSSFGKEKTQIRFLTSEEFELHLGKEKKRYRHVGALAPWFNQTVLAGAYTDGVGKKYRFTELGQAEMPGKSFRYVIAYDTIAFANDRFYEVLDTGEEGLVYGYQVQGDSVLLYETAGPMGEEWEKEPFARLQKTGN